MFQNVKNKKILLGVTGRIAAYKAAEINRLMMTSSAEVKVIMTKSATELIRPLTFATLSKNPVYTESFPLQIPRTIEI